MWRGHRPTRPRPERLLSTYSVQGHSAFPIPVLSPQPRAPPRMERWPLGQVTSSGEDGSSHPARPRGHGPGPQPALSKRLLGSRGAAPGRSRGGRVASGEQVALPGHHPPVGSVRMGRAPPHPGPCPGPVRLAAARRGGGGAHRAASQLRGTSPSPPRSVPATAQVFYLHRRLAERPSPSARIRIKNKIKNQARNAGPTEAGEASPAGKPLFANRLLDCGVFVYTF